MNRSSSGLRTIVRAVMLAMALLIGGALGSAWYVAPLAIRGELTERLKNAAHKRGFELQVESTYIDPFERLVLDGVVVQDRTRRGAPPIARIARIDVRYQVHGALSPKVFLQEITVHSPRLHIHRDKAGRTNIDSVLKRVKGTKKGGGGTGGMRKYLSTHVPKLIVRDLALALDDDKGAPLITPVGIDARHLRLKNASLTIENSSGVRETARFALKGQTSIAGFGETMQVEGQLQWPQKAGWVQVELPGDFAVQAKGFSIAVRRVTAHSNGRIGLGGVSIERLPAQDSPFALDVRQIAVSLSATAAPLSSIPDALRKRLPGQAIAALRHIGEVTIESPVIVGKRPAERIAAADQKKKRRSKMLLPRKTKRTDSEGETSGKKKKRAKKKRRRKRRTAKDKALGKQDKPKTDGKKVRDALVRVFSGASDRLEARLVQLRKAAAAIPVRRIVVRNGRARYRDERLDSKAASEVSDFSAEIDRGADGIVAMKLRFGVPGGGEVQNAVSGRVHAVSGDSQVSVRLDRLPVAPYAAVMPTAVTLRGESAIRETLVTLRYDSKKRVIALEGRGTMEHIDFDLPAISRTRIADLSLKARGKVRLDLGTEKVAIDDGRVELGKVQVLFDGSITNYRTAPVFDMAGRIPTVLCQHAVDSIVPRFAPVLKRMRCSGTMAFRVGFSLNTANMRSLKFEFEPTLRKLKIDSLGRYIDFAVLEGPFEHHARQPDSTLYTFVTGPGAERWVPIEEISEHLVKVVTTTEDGLFFYHKGFSLKQIRGAMVANLRKGRFVRGASTISQQMVKNLFFVEREKTISRKVQEAVVTWEMEHRLTKQQILELYFNIIEFGPRIYGIKAAANHYFNRAPSQLTLLQAIWLGSIIPGPRKFYHQFVRGSSGDTWREYLCWIGRIMHKREKITTEQLNRLGGCNVIFGGAPDGSEEPDEAADFGLGHDGDPTIGDDSTPHAAGEGQDDGLNDALRRIEKLKRKRAAPSVSDEDQP